MDINSAPPDIPSPEWKSPRTWLAVGVPAICIVCIFILSFMLFHDPGEKDTFEHKKDILNLLLPLTGTWIGTIFAFYFSRDNFVAANQSVRELAATVSSSATGSVSILAKDRMIPLQKMIFTTDPDPDLFVLVKTLTAGDRLPIFDKSSNAVRYVLHRSIIDRYAAMNRNASTLPLSVLLQDSNVLKVAESFGICPETATLGDVKDTMYRIPNCQDVFLTKTGQTTEPVIGWLTNVILQDNLKG